jgi:hypothetical protein
MVGHDGRILACSALVAFALMNFYRHRFSGCLLALLRLQFTPSESYSFTDPKRMQIGTHYIQVYQYSLPHKENHQ